MLDYIRLYYDAQRLIATAVENKSETLSGMRFRVSFVSFFFLKDPYAKPSARARLIG